MPPTHGTTDQVKVLILLQSLWTAGGARRRRALTCRDMDDLVNTLEALPENDDPLVSPLRTTAP